MSVNIEGNSDLESYIKENLENLPENFKKEDFLNYFQVFLEKNYRELHEKNKVIETLRKNIDLFEENSKKDFLTGLYNRKGLDELLSEIVNLKEEFALSVFDLARFKGPNDSYGHQVGDKLLTTVSDYLSKSTQNRLFRGRGKRESNIRYGGDEFIQIIPGNVEYTLEELKREFYEINGLTCKINKNREIQIAASMGVVHSSEFNDFYKVLEKDLLLDGLLNLVSFYNEIYLEESNKSKELDENFIKRKGDMVRESTFAHPTGRNHGAKTLDEIVENNFLKNFEQCSENPIFKETNLKPIMIYQMAKKLSSEPNILDSLGSIDRFISGLIIGTADSYIEKVFGGGKYKDSKNEFIVMFQDYFF